MPCVCHERSVPAVLQAAVAQPFVAGPGGAPQYLQPPHTPQPQAPVVSTVQGPVYYTTPSGQVIVQQQPITVQQQPSATPQPQAPTAAGIFPTQPSLMEIPQVQDIGDSVASKSNIL